MTEVKSTVPARIAKHIGDMIADSRLHPNEHLVELSIASEFKTSRAPVREALLMLEKEGLVTRLPHRGFVVKKYSYEEIHQLYDATFRLEEIAFEKAARLATETDFDRLDEILNDQAAAMEAHDIWRYYELNEEFHALLMQIARNSFIARTHASLRRSARPLSLLNIGQGQNMNLSHAEHCRQIEALKQRDVAAGLQAIRAQEERSIRTLDRFYPPAN